MGVLDAADLLHGAESRVDRLDIGFHSPMVVLGARVPKYHGEQGEPALDEKFEQAAPRSEIKRIVLVDDGGHEEDRTMPDLFGLRSVLDEFEHLVLHHDVAGRHR